MDVHYNLIIRKLYISTRYFMFLCFLFSYLHLIFSAATECLSNLPLPLLYPPSLILSHPHSLGPLNLPHIVDLFSCDDLVISVAVELGKFPMVYLYDTRGLINKDKPFAEGLPELDLLI